MSLDMINPEFLITLVENRPTLWDKSLSADPCERTAAWKDICRILNPDFNTLTKTEQHVCVRLVMKKWANIRDAWKKSVTDLKRKTYKYSARLKFLEKNLKNKKDLSWSITVSDDSDIDSESFKNSDNIKKEDQEETAGNDVNTIQFMNMKPLDENCPHISFVKGVRPILNKLQEDEVLEFQMEVIQLLRDIRRKGMTVNQVSRQRYDLSHIKEDSE